MTKNLETHLTHTKGACELCSEYTHQMAWNHVYEQWDYLCQSCSRAWEPFEYRKEDQEK